MKRICIFGDSIAWGCNDIEGNGWADRLKRFFQKEYDERVYNLGVSKDKSTDLVKRFKHECKARNPELIIIAIGINDSQYIGTPENPRVSTEDFKENLTRILQEGKKFTDEIMFVGLNKVDELKTMPWNTQGKNYYSNDVIEEYDLIIRDVCSENNLKYIKVVDIITEDRLSDGLHPNIEGHKEIYDRVKDVIFG